MSLSTNLLGGILQNIKRRVEPDKRSGEAGSRIVSNTGLVIPADFDWRNAKSLGLRLVISLVKQLQGTIDRTKTGTVYHTSIPKKDR
jgi:two-component sensor histidine kinase